MQAHVYDNAFSESIHWAKINVDASLPIVLAELAERPKTVIDVGCGPGAWIRELNARGFETFGVDGPWAEADLLVPKDRFFARNLESPLFLDRRFDLAISIEVAEHLSPARGPVSSLTCAHCQTLCFSPRPSPAYQARYT